METYKKPVIVEESSTHGVFPAVAAAFASGIALGLAKGKTEIDSTHTQTLMARKPIHD